MKIVVNPCEAKGYTGTGKEIMCNAFAEINIDANGRLSIHGVIGPKRNGNCYGSAGQCVDAIRKGVPNEEDGWTYEMLDRFCKIWDEWHLNDMRPYCEHQAALGWDEEASEEVNTYYWTKTVDAIRESDNVKSDVLNRICRGETVEATEDEITILNLKYEILTNEDDIGLIPEKIRKYYQPKKALYNGGDGHVKTECRGWIRYDKDDRGILCKPCPVCGYKYGSAWKREELPQDVIDFLMNLPRTKVEPAWV